MAATTKYAYHALRKQLETSSRLLRYNEFEALKATLTKAVEACPEVLVEKVRRTTEPGRIFDMTARWVGLDPTPSHAAKEIAPLWPGVGMDAAQERHFIETEEDRVILRFVSVSPDGDFITGQVTVIC